MRSETQVSTLGRTWIIALLFFLAAFPAMAEDYPLSLPSSATQPITGEPEQPFPNLDLEASAEVLQKEIHAGEPFDYQIVLSWKGNPTWVSLKQPEIQWPREIRQIKVGTGVRSSPSAGGPVGSKFFKYTLVCDKAGSQHLPEVSVEVTPEGKDAFPVTAPSVGFEVKEAHIPASMKAQAFLKRNGLVLGGIAFVVLAGLVVSVISKRKSRPPEEEAADPWLVLDSDLKKMDALRFAGEGREFYGELEGQLRSALRISVGFEGRDLSKATDLETVPGPAREDLAKLVSDINERKFRPDRPKSEEMSSALGQMRALVRALKERFPKGGC
jgi:hypothetical protein